MTSRNSSLAKIIIDCHSPRVSDAVFCTSIRDEHFFNCNNRYIIRALKILQMVYIKFDKKCCLLPVENKTK